MPAVKTKKSTKRTSTKKYWSKNVTEHSNAMDLEKGVFKRSPRAIAQSLKRSVESSTRLKSDPFRSAMSMLNFYENRAGRNLSAQTKAKLQQAKEELRILFGKEKTTA